MAKKGSIKHKSGFRVGFANFFGVLAYLSVAFQWVFLALIYFRFIYEVFLGPMKDILPSKPVTHIDPTPVVQAPSEPSLLLIIFGVVIVGLMLALSIYAIIKAPSIVAGAGKKVVDTATEQTTKAVLHVSHKKDTPRNRKKLTPRFILLFKFILVALPLILALCSQWLPERILSMEVTMVLSLGLAAGSIILFGIQYILSIILHLDRKALK